MGIMRSRYEGSFSPTSPARSRPRCRRLRHAEGAARGCAAARAQEHRPGRADTAGHSRRRVSAMDKGLSRRGVSSKGAPATDQQPVEGGPGPVLHPPLPPGSGGVERLKVGLRPESARNRIADRLVSADCYRAERTSTPGRAVYTASCKWQMAHCAHWQSASSRPIRH
jgi:hypothetical protein